MKIFYKAALLAALMPASQSAFAEEAKVLNSNKADKIMIYEACIRVNVKQFYALDASAYEVADAAHGSCSREYMDLENDYDKILIDQAGPFPDKELELIKQKAVRDWKERFRYEAISSTLFLRLADKNKQQAKPAQ